MAKVEKVYGVEIYSYRNDRSRIVEDTLPNLIKYFSYTLECGASYSHEKGNKKINREPKSIKSLITNLNNAKSNSAANGSASKHYSLVEA